MTSNIHRALIFQGGGSLGAYEAGAYKAISEELSVFLKNLQEKEKKEGEPTIFHIVSGTSIGAINAAILVRYVKENKTFEGSGQRLVDFWEYLSTNSIVESVNPYFAYYWDFWNGLAIALHQVSLPEDITVPKNLFSEEFLTYSGQKYQKQMIDSLIHQIHGILLIMSH